MVEPLDESKPLPFAPGEGPFRIKGEAYRGHLQYVSEYVPGGVDAMLAGFKDPRLVEFFKQRFLAASFYDMVPLVAAGYVCARLTGKSFSEFVRIRARYQAERDVGGIYRVLLKLTSPAHVLSRLPALVSQYLDIAGEAEAVTISPKRVELRRTGMPAMLLQWFVCVNETYIEVVTTRAGAKIVVARSLPPEPDAPVHGFAAVKYRCEVTWE